VKGGSEGREGSERRKEGVKGFDLFPLVLAQEEVHIVHFIRVVLEVKLDLRDFKTEGFTMEFVTTFLTDHFTPTFFNSGRFYTYFYGTDG
jgi:hypothetical protein